MVSGTFASAGDPTVAEGQMRYMRNQFAYYGLKAPVWVGLLRQIFKEHGLLDGAELIAFARMCFDMEYHEMFYAGLQMVEKQLKSQPSNFIDFLEEAIIAGNWWDTVDWIAKLVGQHFIRYPELQRPVSEQWIRSDNIWLQRVAIIHQLLLKDRTNVELMLEMILYRKDSKEFFIQKGSGWALRQHSKIDPDFVRAFCEAHPNLSALTRREGMRLIKAGKA